MKAAFDVNVLNTEATFEAAHGAIKRPTHRNSPFDAARFEQCAHKWADLSEGDYGVSILNDCKYGYDILDSRMRITLLRAPTNPDPKGDLGYHKFTYSFYPHAGTWQTGGTVQEAFLLNLPLDGKEVAPNKGTLPAEHSFISCDVDDVIIDTVKAAQEYGFTKIALAGGVSANSRLRKRMTEVCDKNGWKLYMPELCYCGDNAAMVGAQAYYEFIKGNIASLDLNAFATMPIDG
jgi:alpha-mannosidase